MKNAQLNNPIARWNHRIPSLIAAIFVTGVLLAGIAALSSPATDSALSPLAVAAQSNAAG